MIFLWSSDKIKKVFDVSYFKKLNSNLLISFIFDLSAKPEFSEKKFCDLVEEQGYDCEEYPYAVKTSDFPYYFLTLLVQKTLNR
jgi:hypothetical protein